MTDHTSADTELRHDAEQQRYVLERGGELAGFAHYTRTSAGLEFDHTVVEPAYRGGGVASQLVQYALDDVRDHSDARVIPTCSYVAAWLERHPEYQELTRR